MAALIPPLNDGEKQKIQSVLKPWQYAIFDDNNGTVTVSGIDPMGVAHKATYPQAGVLQWAMGTLIQNTTLILTPAEEREWLISGYSPKSFAAMFPPDEDEPQSMEALSAIDMYNGRLIIYPAAVARMRYDFHFTKGGKWYYINSFDDPDDDAVSRQKQSVVSAGQRWRIVEAKKGTIHSQTEG